MRANNGRLFLYSKKPNTTNEGWPYADGRVCSLPSGLLPDLSTKDGPVEAKVVVKAKILK